MRHRARYRHRVLLWALLSAGTTLSGSAGAQQPGDDLPEGFTIGRLDAERTSLRQRIGVDRAEDLLQSSSWRERVRGIERLASDGSDEAVDALVEAMADESAIFTNPITRLEAVRALAPHAAQDQARRVMFNLLSGGDVDVPDTPLERLARATAAMALAAADDPKTVGALTTAVIGRGVAGELAREALLAHPPSSLEPLLRGYKRRLPPAVVELLGDLRDPRAIGVLRYVLAAKSEAAKEPAALALARLGDAHAAVVARQWLKAPSVAAKDKRKRTDHRLAAVSVLVELDTSDAAAALAALLGDAATRTEALSIAERSLSPALVPTLAAVVAAPVAEDERARALTMLTRIGGPRAVEALAKQLASSQDATAAAVGLARIRGNDAATALAGALASAAPGAPKRLIVRAALVRWLRTSERVAGLEAALTGLAASGDAADRAVAGFGDVLLGRRSVAELVAAADEHPELLGAAARAALARGPSALSAFAPRLRASSSSPDVDVSASAVALLAGPAGLSASQLASAAERGGWWAPLAALRLAANDSRYLRPRLEALLAGTDPLVRQHVVLGLGLSPERSAVALLTEAYRREASLDVRRAIVRALSRRTEVRRLATLRLARDLDPDPQVRAMASSALSGRSLDITGMAAGHEVAWISLRANQGAAAPAVRAALLVRSGLPALPVVSDPDGVLLAPGVRDVDELALRLALAGPSDQP